MQKLQNTKRKVITLCGSTRFREAFQMANARLTMEGCIVLSVGFFMHAEGQHTKYCALSELSSSCNCDTCGDMRACGVHPPKCTCGARGITEEQKADLDLLHFDKIQMSHGIYVVNVAGYVGASTMREIAYAVARGKTIEWLEPQAGNDYMERRSHELGAQVARFVEGYVPDLVVL